MTLHTCPDCGQQNEWRCCVNCPFGWRQDSRHLACPLSWPGPLPARARRILQGLVKVSASGLPEPRRERAAASVLYLHTVRS